MAKLGGAFEAFEMSGSETIKNMIGVVSERSDDDQLIELAEVLRGEAYSIERRLALKKEGR